MRLEGINAYDDLQRWIDVDLNAPWEIRIATLSYPRAPIPGNEYTFSFYLLHEFAKLVYTASRERQ